MPSVHEIPSISPDTLITPYLLGFAKKLRAGKKIAFDQKFSVPCTWGEEELERIHNGIRQWLKHGDFQLLAKLLQNEPKRIVHPIIMGQIQRLSNLANRFEVNDSFLDEYYVDYVDQHRVRQGHGPLFPPGTRHAARKALLTLFQGLWDGLGSGGVLYVKAKTIHGRPTDCDRSELEELLEDYNDLRMILGDEAEPTQATEYPLRRMSRESKSEFLKRITVLVQQIHLQSKYLKQFYSRDERIYCVEKPLPQRIARLIANQAIPKRSVQVHILLSGLLAHYRDNDHTKWCPIYKKIQRA